MRMDYDDRLRGLVLATAPTWEPLTLAQAKRHVQISPDDHQFDGELSALITAAREQFEHETGVICADSAWSFTCDEWPDDAFELHARPVQSITSITYYDTASAQQTLASSVYRLDTGYATPRIGLKYNQSWPSSRRWEGDIVVTFQAGYATPGAVPGRVMQALLLLIGHWFDQRNAVNVGNIVNTVPLSYSHLVAGMQRSSYP